MVAVSYLTPSPAAEKIRGLTFSTRSTEDRTVSRASWRGRDVAASGLVLLLILMAYLYFRG
jgi:SSS family solute:Na+ symporter